VIWYRRAGLVFSVVFGGISLYKSPEEALKLALKREMKDLRESGFTVEGLTEFIRDMIAKLNGMYHVMAIDPDLLSRPSRPTWSTPARAPRGDSPSASRP